MSPRLGLRRDRPAAPDRWLPLKTALFVGAAVVAFLGMALRRDWLVSAAIGLLALGILLRFVRPREHDAPPGEGPPPAA